MHGPASKGWRLEGTNVVPYHDLGEDKIVLGYPWLAAFQPKIDWKNAVTDESMQPLIPKAAAKRRKCSL